MERLSGGRGPRLRRRLASVRPLCSYESHSSLKILRKVAVLLSLLLAGVLAAAPFESRPPPHRSPKEQAERGAASGEAKRVEREPPAPRSAPARKRRQPTTTDVKASAHAAKVNRVEIGRESAGTVTVEPPPPPDPPVRASEQ